MTVWLRLAVTLLLAAASLVGCQDRDRPGPADGTDRFVFQTDRELVVVDGVTVVARLQRESTGTGADRIPLTKDGRFLYAAGTSSISVLDTRSLHHREIPCTAPCAPVALGASLIGWFAADPDGGQAERAEVRAIDLAAPEPTLRTLGWIQLPQPPPAEPRATPYSYFLDAAPGEYLFFGLDPEIPVDGQPWAHPQTLFRARLDGTTTGLGRYGGFDRAIDVWAVLNPDGDRVVLNGVAPAGQPGGCAAAPGYAPVDLIDLPSAQTTRIHPPAPDPRDHLRATRAWWGNNGTAYVAYTPTRCGTDHGDDGPPPSVWAYQDGSWSQLDTGGPAILALPLAGGRLAVVAPDGRPGEVPHGTLVFIDAEGHRTHIADAVTAIAPLPPRTAG
ncbi:hypothetical protein [Mycobacterium sp. 1274756.6]|uniref:hypothetical protein n=1 Tax=Mycobacterium sp. 1274756.6 TaxID=1834076 RepID=UPI0007FFCE0C|nr:hypothetical protein [Mycobacterium sp. 1274756.6]OBJ73396.1 hypothetical protein A5643_03850 [Mycobacterium sp. 1274756.6]